MSYSKVKYNTYYICVFTHDRIENMDAKGNDLVELPKDIWKMSGLNRIDVSDNLMTGEAHKHVSNMSQICHEKVLSFICVYVLQATFIT